MEAGWLLVMAVVVVRSFSGKGGGPVVPLREHVAIAPFAVGLMGDGL